ncbi:hypothetical protein ACFSUD_05360 [Sulfitobacter aestuarii]|uniref:Phosphodiester glycosidase domain-containing protein n=1 Tax=Sulfitobacter aestuarii TaxID=2161676 RepID=A0ABW5TZP1_9RHOB
MSILHMLLLAFLPQAALSCGTPVCLIDAQELSLPRIIDFNGLRAAPGPGLRLDANLVLSGASFGEHFLGQSVHRHTDHDQISGKANAPLTLMPGPPGENLSLVHFSGTSVLNGYGRAGFPRRDGQGEGAIALLFEEDQSALSLLLRGGDQGEARILFLRRDGSLIAALTLSRLGESALGFARSGDVADIAGLVLTNTDPQGIALDILRFGKAPGIS